MRHPVLIALTMTVIAVVSIDTAAAVPDTVARYAAARHPGDADHLRMAAKVGSRRRIDKPTQPQPRKPVGDTLIALGDLEANIARLASDDDDE